MIYTYFGHHKAATKWILNIVNSICDVASLNHRQFHSPKGFDYQAEKYVNENNINFFSYTNANWEFVNNLKCKGFHVIRDPRDIMVSAYFSHLHSHSDEHWPELTQHRNYIRSLPKELALLESMKFTARLPTDGLDLNLINSMYDWNYDSKNILEVKYENLINNQYRQFRKIFKHMGLVANFSFVKRTFPGCEIILSDEVLKEVIDRNRFKVLSGGRQMGQENTKNHYRKGVPGDWRNHFTETHKKYFKYKYGDLLIKLNYEKNDDW